MHANIWIREHNRDAWKNLESKAEFVNAALEGGAPRRAPASTADAQRTDKQPVASEIIFIKGGERYEARIVNVSGTDWVEYYVPERERWYKECKL